MKRREVEQWLRARGRLGWVRIVVGESMTDEKTLKQAFADWMATPDPTFSGARPDYWAEGFRAGLAHTRQWRPLTDDPATWPGDGQRVLLYSREAEIRGTTYGLHEVRGFYADLNRAWWTHWCPLPEPPKRSTEVGGVYDTEQQRWWPRTFNSPEAAQAHYEKAKGPGSRGVVRQLPQKGDEP